MKIQRVLQMDGSVVYAERDGTGIWRRLDGGIGGGFFRTDEMVDVEKVLAPVEPPAVFCTGLNYRKHAEETGARIPKFPVLFMKAPTAVQNPGDPIVLPVHLASHQVDYECELAIVIGKEAKNVSRERALEHVLGFCCANDVSARDWQKDFGGSQWCRGKTFDTFLPLGPAIVTPDEVGNPDALAIRTLLNGSVMQESNTSDMIFDVASLVEFFSGSTTLRSGTVILTGTPSGVGMARTPPVWLRPGDVVEIEIERVGSLVNPVVAEC
ncbi:MAG: fumarylacetoacetate hydrolase family protein [Terrimicrobiaceae bacterium]|nr:fumarylacetoacetate hydrolase family protein [Terrimicrobiaceae bacterium]